MHFNKLKFPQKIIGISLMMALITSCAMNSDSLKEGVFVCIEGIENNFSLRNYGYLVVSEDTIVLNSYGPSYNIKMDERLFVRKKDNIYQNPIDNELIVAKSVNDTIIEIEFEDDFNQRYTWVDDQERSVDFDFGQKQFRYKLDKNTYLMEFYGDSTAIGINEASKDLVKYRWRKIKLANQWFLILSNNLYSYHLKIDSIVEKNVLLSRFLESPKQLELKNIDLDTAGNEVK